MKISAISHPRLSKLLEVAWVAPAVSFIWTLALIAVVVVLHYGGYAIKSQWFWSSMLLSVPVSIIVGTISLLAVLLIWLVGACEFKDIRRMLLFSVLDITAVCFAITFVFPKLFRS